MPFPATLCCLLLLAPSMATAQCDICGDVDDSGYVTPLDALLVLQHVAGQLQLPPAALICADVDGDGQLTGEDARLISEFHAGEPVELICRKALVVYEPCGEMAAITDVVRRNLDRLQVVIVHEPYVPDSLDEFEFILDMRYTTPITPEEADAYRFYVNEGRGGIWLVGGSLSQSSSRGQSIEEWLRLIGDLEVRVIAHPEAVEEVAIARLEPGQGESLHISNSGWFFKDSLLAQPHFQGVSSDRAYGISYQPDRLFSGSPPILATFVGNACLASTGGECADTQTLVIDIFRWLGWE